jgi:hypothetical protein
MTSLIRRTPSHALIIGLYAVLIAFAILATRYPV